jgi:hypothetical protein
MSVVTMRANIVIHPSHAKASMAVRIRHAWYWEQNEGRFGQMDCAVRVHGGEWDIMECVSLCLENCGNLRSR